MKTIITDITSRQDFFKGIGLLEAGCAWLSFGAIIALEHLLNKDMHVLELGSGGSTVFFAKRTYVVTSIESDEKWLNAVAKRISHLSNVNMFYKNEEETIRLINEFDNNMFDVILVDTGRTKEHTPNRKLLAETAIPKLKTGGYLILDNYEYYGNKDFNYKGFDVYTFDEFGYSGRGTRILRKK